MELAIVVFVCVIGGLIGVAAAKTRGFSPIFGFVLGFLVPFLSPALFLLGKSTGTRPCPYCAEKVKVSARVCKHCGRDLLGASSGAAHAR